MFGKSLIYFSFTPDFTEQSTKFAIDFYRNVFNTNENAILSPLSIQSTLSLLYHVANAKTASEMQRILGLPANPEQLRLNLQNLLNRTNSDDLRMASKIYHSQLSLHPDFLPVLQKSLGVDVEPANFTHKQEVADSVNQWAARSTKGLINEIISPIDIRDSEHVILLNAIVLDAKWKEPFWPFTIEKVFHFTNGDHIVGMMFMDGYFSYGEFDGLKALELPYEDHTDLSMVLILPTTGSLEDLVKRFNMELYTKMDSVMDVEKGEIEIPKFKTSSKIKAKDVLQSMGLESAFEEGAFGVFAEHPAQLTELRQNAVIEVSESGTKAAAITGKYI